MFENAREFDAADPLEKAILDSAEAEGLVIWSRNADWGDVTERQLVAVVAGPQGPELFCARAWPAALNSGVIVRLDLRCKVEDACRPFLSKSADALPRIGDLHSRDSYDVAVAHIVGAQAGCLWRSADTKSAVFLLRTRAEDGRKNLAVATAESTRATGGTKANAELHLTVPVDEFAAWVQATFGARLIP